MLPRGHTRINLDDGEATWLLELLSLGIGNRAHDATRRRLRKRLSLARNKARKRMKPVLEE